MLCSFDSIIIPDKPNIKKALKSSGFRAFCCLVVFVGKFVDYAVFEGDGPDFAVFYTKV